MAKLPPTHQQQVQAFWPNTRALENITQKNQRNSKRKPFTRKQLL